MQGIVFIMSHTSNTYFDIMNMPFAVYKSILKNLYIQEMSKIPEWQEAYNKWKLKQEYQSNKSSKSKVKQSCDVEGLKSLLNSL